MPLPRAPGYRRIVSLKETKLGVAVVVSYYIITLLLSR